MGGFEERSCTGMLQILLQKSLKSYQEISHGGHLEDGSACGYWSFPKQGCPRLVHSPILHNFMMYMYVLYCIVLLREWKCLQIPG